MHQHRYIFLDGMRGLAALFVLTVHTFDFWHFKFFHSYLAVDLFFVLSGFVLAHAYDERLAAKTMSIKKFILVRLIRLYPMFFFSILLSFLSLLDPKVLGEAGSSALLCASIAILLFLPYHVAGSTSLFPLNEACWSLEFELITNAIYAAVRPRLDDFKLLRIIIISGLGVVGIAFTHGGLNAGFNWTAGQIAAGLFRSVFGIFMGLLLYRKHTALMARCAGLSPWILFPVVGAILAAPSMGFFDSILDIAAVLFIFPVCILIGAQNVPSRFKNGLLALGSASYPLYVLHVPTSKILLYALGGTIGAYAPLSGILFALVLFTAALVLEKAYDLPVRRMLSKRVPRGL